MDDNCQFNWSQLLSITDGQWLASPPVDRIGVSAVGTDSRQLCPGALFVALRGDRFDGHDFVQAVAEQGAGAVCVDRDWQPCSEVEIPVLQVESTLVAYQRLAQAHQRRFSTLKTIAITGSSGKTSTKEIIGAIVRQAHGDGVLLTEGNTNNHIGVPQNLLRLREHQAAVLELGTNAPGEIALLAKLCEPDVAIVTSIGPVHLEGLGSVDGVAAEKASLFAALPQEGLAIVPYKWYQHPAVKSQIKASTITFGTEAEADYRVDYLGGDFSGGRFRLSRPDCAPLEVAWSLPGAHQAVNAAAGFAVAARFGIPDADVLAALATCRLPGMRMQVQEIEGVHWVNDAYNANPDSMRALIDCIAQNPPSSLYLVLGDMLELGEDEDAFHQAVVDHASKQLPDAKLLLVGPRMGRVTSSTATSFANAEALAEHLHRRLCPGDWVVLKGSRGMALEKALPDGQ